MPANIKIEAEIAAKLNFASHQNAFPLLSALRVENLSTDEHLDNLTLRLRANPPFIKEKAWAIDRVAPQGQMTVWSPNLVVDREFLLRLVEKISGSVSIQVEKDGSVLEELSRPVELLAPNEWGGTEFIPELLAAFSVPTDPAVDKILSSAAKILRESGKNVRMQGYESAGNRKGVWEIASAIYSAIANLGLEYAVPPASFEKNGQKIRLPGQIIDGGVATCLDTAMLFASAFEQAGLNPVIALPEGHALVGVWLQPEEFSTIVVDEAEALRKRIALSEMVLIETTFVTSHPSPRFSEAINAAKGSISIDNDRTFTAVVDIRQARRADRIMPLGLLEKPAPGGVSAEDALPQAEQPLEEAPPLPDFDSSDSDEKKPETPGGRLERWQRKLLDLSLRNPLLNHRATKTSLEIICPKPGLLEDKLAGGAKIKILPTSGPLVEGQDEEIHQQRTGGIVAEEYAVSQLEQNPPCVCVNLPKEDLEKRVVEIYRKTQTALQEGGANTLYLALGFLCWKREEKVNRQFRAPLILYPVALERKSIRSGVKIIAHDDEPRFNTTLLQMLRKDYQIDIHGLDGELPTDESGIDVRGIWNHVRKEVKETSGFEVVEDVVLGHFSFAKYLMWKDIADRTDALRGNDVVRHLVDTPGEEYASDVDFVEPSEVDRKYKPSDLLTPLPADASQLAAIATADRGKDFVIIGPPGTGKSQTIANMIAHFLGMEKTVLFVSEKTAALEVVYRRLEEVGLGRFCLELHSNKARKADVLNQLRRSWDDEADSESEAQNWQEQAEDLRKLRDSLNDVVERLHKKRRNGLTAHYAIGVKVRDEELADCVALSWPTADCHDGASLKAMRDAVDNLAIQVESVGDVSKSPFHLVANARWTPQWEDQIVEQAGHLSETARDVEHARDALCEAIGIVLPNCSMERFDALGDLAGVLIDSYRKPAAWALEPDGPDQIKAWGEAAERLKGYAKAQESLKSCYKPFAWRDIDGEDIRRRWTETKKVWWPLRFFAKRKILEEMRAHGAYGKPIPERDVGILARWRQEGEAIDLLDRRLSGFMDWLKHDTEPAVAELLCDLGERTRSTTGKLADSPQALVETRAKVRGVLHDGNDLLAPDASVGRVAATFREKIENLQQASRELEKMAGASVRETFASSNCVLEQIQKTADTIAARRDELRDWCKWRNRRAEAIDGGLLPLVEAVEQGRIASTPEDIRKAFEVAYCTWWSKAVTGEDEVLCAFSTPEHENTIKKFCRADDDYQKLTARYIVAKLSSNLPERDGARKGTELGVIQRELQKRTRHIPVRQLLEKAPGALTLLAPCFMMSPLSVAQYLSPNQSLFDVIIFDEASQITVWDAVGAIARGRQVIVAGDPKQMPPTNFFARSDDDPDGEIDEEEDLESILDEMLSANIQKHTLNLHYRSRKESLIAFSNSKYYENGLVTFPAPDVEDQGVRLVKPDGFYARGGARHNQGEAKAIVREVVERLTHCDAGRLPSIGVVTFNSEQQRLIEDLLDKERSRRPEIERAFSYENNPEPVFVKNLETVQGDERDIILFSVTYGPDQAGQVTMNFGPLNREGGERRLNVAMTRARTEMMVFSTLDPNQIDLSRSQARAVRDLKYFLEYAEKGRAVLGSELQGSVGDFDSPFEMAVARALQEKGWQVLSQVGVSKYRIDLGIVHPDEPGRYLAGIECDGAMYHSSACARERDKIRQTVLEGLGWTLLRIWSTDWWTNKSKEIKKVDNALRRYLEKDRRETSGSEEAPTDGDASVDTGFDSAAGMSDEEPAPPAYITYPGGAEKGIITQSHPSCDMDGKGAGRESGLVQRAATKESGKGGVPANNRYNPRYVVACLNEGGLEPDSERFYDDEYKVRLRAMLDYVIDTEGPIHEDVLVRRIARHHGFRRAGRKIKDVVISLANQRRGKTRERVGIFFWPKGAVKERMAPARYQGRTGDLLKAEYICTEELQAIDRLLLCDCDAVAVARVLGIARLSESAKVRIESAIRDIQPNQDMET